MCGFRKSDTSWAGGTRGSVSGVVSHVCMTRWSNSPDVLVYSDAREWGRIWRAVCIIYYPGWPGRAPAVESRRNSLSVISQVWCRCPMRSVGQLWQITVISMSIRSAKPPEWEARATQCASKLCKLLSQFKEQANPLCLPRELILDLLQTDDRPQFKLLYYGCASKCCNNLDTKADCSMTIIKQG